jgi:hypothetical protein
MQFIKSKRRLVALAFAFMFAAGSAIYCTRTPTHDGEWIATNVRLPELSIRSNQNSIRGIRDFRYDETGAVSQLNYIDRNYDLSQLNGVWYGLSHFADHGFAHAFLSFEFIGHNGKPEYLVASIEARLRPGQSYHPISGLLRAFHRIVVLCTEEDIIGLRTHHRHERVLLYPLRLSQENRLSLARSVFSDADAMSTHPEFYNTALDNCITGILQYTPEWESYLTRLDYRVMLPGLSDELAFKYGYIDGATNLEELRQRAEIRSPAAFKIDADYSKNIRLAW